MALYQDLFDVLADLPDGTTKPDLCTRLDATPDRLDRAIRQLRRVLGEGDTINLIAEPDGLRQPWRYRLVGKLDEARPWVKNRRRDLTTRIRTMALVADSLVAGSDGRTLDGRKARLMATTLHYLVEQLDLLDGKML